MQGKLLDQVRRDAAKFATSGGFEDDIVLTTPDGSKVAAVKGLTAGRWESFDTDGSAVNTQTFHITIPESSLLALGYPTRSNGRIKMEKHKVLVSDSNGDPRNFIVSEVYPNATTGLIVMILGRAE